MLTPKHWRTHKKRTQVNPAVAALKCSAWIKKESTKFASFHSPPFPTTTDHDLSRKGYEYPAKELLLKIQTGTTKDGKPQITYVNVRHLKNIFPALEGADLIDLFVQIACEKYSDDEKLCKAIRDNSFSGGLRYDTKRYMYVLNMDKREDGIRM